MRPEDNAWISEAPWTPEQVANLNAYQRSGRMHPFTCGSPGYHDTPQSPVLIAHEDGWFCPAPLCDYTQNWAHGFMTEPLPPSDFHDRHTEGVEPDPDREAHRAVARVRSLHHEYRSVYDEGDDRSCAHCNQISGYAVPWPCPTIKALEGIQ